MMRTLATVLMAAFVLSLSAVYWSALQPNVLVMSASAFAFAFVAIAIAWKINAGVLAQPASAADRGLAARALRTTSHITALVYAWGGAAMLIVYRLTNVHWQHGWQYGTAMLLIAIGLYGYLSLLNDEQSALSSDIAIQRAVYLAILQSLAITGALIWLLSSGKLTSGKGDWAANIIFLAGGFGIAAVSAIVAHTHMKITRR